MKKTLAFAFLLYIVVSPVLADDFCKDACDRFILCSEEIHKRKVTPQEEVSGRKGCMDTCQKRKKELNTCFVQYQKSKSCKVYGECIYKAGSKK